MSIIRYPGSKAKLAQRIIESFPERVFMPMYGEHATHYVEPFFGSGAIGFALMGGMSHRCKVTIADADIGIASLWRAVKDHHRELHERVWQYEPSVESFYELKARDGTYTDTVDTGFRKLALHRISVSGFGAKAGGPIGGRSQSSEYNVDCRWRPTRMASGITRLHKLLNKFESLEIRHASVFETLANISTPPESTVVYLDPPYYVKGDQLYAVKFSPAEHVRLAEVLRDAPYWWALSYDDHPTIRELYADFATEKLEVRYSNAVCSEPRRKNHEILILSEKTSCIAV